LNSSSHFSTQEKISSTHQILFIKSTAFCGQNQGIPGILSELSQTIAK
jgi:hypothetical protein